MSSRAKSVAKSSVKGVKGVAKSVKRLIHDDAYTWKELQTIEKRRRAILLRTELPSWRILMFWDGTCLRVLATDPLMWFTMLVYITVRVQARVGMPDYVSDISAGDIGVIGAFLSFFLVFFVVQSNNRFTALYNASMGCKGRIFDVASLCRAILPREHGLRLVRYMNAAYAAGFVGLSSTYSSENFFEELNKTNKFLTDSEYKRFLEIDMNLGGSSNRELIAWCLLDIETAKKAGLIDVRTAIEFRDQILKLRASMGTLYNYQDQPISFFYVHFICLLSALYLPLFAVSQAYNAGTGDDVFWTADLLAGLIVFLQSVFVIGLRLLGQKMSDPFGDDLEDLSVMHYINFTWMQSNRILQSSAPSELDAAEEEEIFRTSKSIGGAWQGDEIFESEILTEDQLEEYKDAPSIYCVVQ